MAILSQTSKVFDRTNGAYVQYKVFNDVNTDETKSDAIDVFDVKAVTLFVEAGAGVSSGVVKLEGAIDDSYSGTWVELGSITTDTASAASAVSTATALSATDTAGLPIRYVRARVETAIGGGTIDAYIIVEK